MSLAPGTRLAQYEVNGPLGSGGMGEVYRARDLRLDRDVALKVMAAHVAADPVMRHRFETEARAVASLSHPSIRSIHELALVDGVPIAVMELLEGETLRRHIERGPIPWREAVTIAAAIADGLAAAHGKGIVHRDLKPENVFLTSDGAVKILDFGLALQRLAAAESVTGAHTAAGIVLGTLGYMSPEQVTGERVDGRSDIFAAGCLLYEMLTGARLFDGLTPQEIVGKLLHDGTREMKPLATSVPAELKAIVGRCVDRQIERRFESAAHLSSALRGLLSGSAAAATTRRAKGRGKSLAVLPFVNTSDDPQADYLTDGITESIINSLSQLPGLRVVPRSLVFRYKGLQSDPATIGLTLNARTILTGRVVNHGEFLDIQAELVDTANEAQLWGERFRRQVSDVLAVQEEIAWQISEALRLKLSPKHKKSLRKRPTVNAEAYQEYLRGRHLWHNWGIESLKKAVEHFLKALEHDPEYALAYAGLGHAYGALSYYGVIAPAEGFPRAQAAAARALQLDPRLAEAHATVAMERFFWGWDWAAAGRSYEKALELDPDNSLILVMYSLFLLTCGRQDEALAMALKARKVDPLSPFVGMGVGWGHHFSGRHEQVIPEMSELMTLHPGLQEAASLLAGTFLELGRYEEAIALLAKQPLWGIMFDASALATAYRSGGSDALMREQLRQAYAMTNRPATTAQWFALVHLRLGEVDRALDHLEGMINDHAGGVVFLGMDPCISKLHGHPRYEALLRRVGIPQPVRAWAPATPPQAKHDDVV